jgi:hypothetical protein
MQALKTTEIILNERIQLMIREIRAG